MGSLLRVGQTISWHRRHRSVVKDGFQNPSRFVAQMLPLRLFRVCVGVCVCMSASIFNQHLQSRVLEKSKMLVSADFARGSSKARSNLELQSCLWNTLNLICYHCYLLGKCNEGRTMQTLFFRPECSPRTWTVLWRSQRFCITVVDYCFLFGARISRLHPGPVCCLVHGRDHDWWLWDGNPWGSAAFMQVPLFAPTFSFLSPLLFKLEIFPLISLIKCLCKWVNLRKSHFPDLTNLMDIQLHFSHCYSACPIPCTAQASLSWCCLLGRHWCLLSLLFCSIFILLLQGWLARGTFPMFTVIHIRLWILEIQTPPDSSEPTSGFNPLQPMWIIRYRGRKLKAILTWELLLVTAATWAFHPIQNMPQPFTGHLKSTGHEGLNRKIAIITENCPVGMCFLQDRVVEWRTPECSFIYI